MSNPSTVDGGVKYLVEFSRVNALVRYLKIDFSNLPIYLLLILLSIS